jgi:hypothetical protein
MGTPVGTPEHLLEALEPRSLFSASLLGHDLPTPLVGDPPVADIDFLFPGQSSGSTPDAPAPADDSDDFTNPFFDADYRDWTWDIQDTMYSGGAGMDWAEFETLPPIDPADLTRGTVDGTLPLPPGRPVLNLARFETAAAPIVATFEDKPAPAFGPSAAAQTVAGPTPDAPAPAPVEPAASPVLPLNLDQAPTPTFLDLNASDKDDQDQAKSIIASSFIAKSMPTSADLILPTLL